MITLEKLKEIIIIFFQSIPCNVEISLFGSFLKGDKTRPADIDLALKFSTVSSEDARTVLACEYFESWESYLSERIGMRAHLSLYEDDDKYIPESLKEASLLLYRSTGKEDEL